MSLAGNSKLKFLRAKTFQMKHIEIFFKKFTSWTPLIECTRWIKLITTALTCINIHKVHTRENWIIGNSNEIELLIYWVYKRRQRTEDSLHKSTSNKLRINFGNFVLCMRVYWICLKYWSTCVVIWMKQIVKDMRGRLEKLLC